MHLIGKSLLTNLDRFPIKFFPKFSMLIDSLYFIINDLPKPEWLPSHSLNCKTEFPSDKLKGRPYKYYFTWTYIVYQFYQHKGSVLHNQMLFTMHHLITLHLYPLPLPIIITLFYIPTLRITPFLNHHALLIPIKIPFFSCSTPFPIHTTVLPHWICLPFFNGQFIIVLLFIRILLSSHFHFIPHCLLLFSHPQLLFYYLECLVRTVRTCFIRI